MAGFSYRKTNAANAFLLSAAFAIRNWSDHFFSFSSLNLVRMSWHDFGGQSVNRSILNIFTSSEPLKISHKILKWTRLNYRSVYVLHA